MHRPRYFNIRASYAVRTSHVFSKCGKTKDGKEKSLVLSRMSEEKHNLVFYENKFIFNHLPILWDM